jgi:Bacterial archaeo-eukaryotic release factor family 7
MAKRRVTGEIDLVSVGDIADLGSVDGPCVSLFLPTHRFGSQTQQDPVRLRNLIDAAASDLRRQASPENVIDGLLEPMHTLVDDGVFWQHQADGLAIFSAPGRFVRFRVALPLVEEVTVAASFRVRPLLPAVFGDEAFFLLSLSQNSVRLFEATRFTVGEVTPGPIIGSMAETLANEDPERQLQYHSAGREAQFHGHGAGGEIDKAALERFFRAVDRAVIGRLGDSRRPLMLACVGYYLPIYQSVTRYPHLFDAAVEGNPEHLSPADLHAAAWPLLESVLAPRRDGDLDRFRDAVGTVDAVTELEEIVLRAREGRVDTLFVTEGPALWGRLDPDDDTVTTATQPSIASEDLVDRAVLDTLSRGGTIRVVDAATIGAEAGALLRY